MHHIINQHNIHQHIESHPKSVIVVYGPTASGKSDLAIEVASKNRGEIISVDARQIYKHMDIGTGKIPKNAMQGIPHHMIDIIDPSENFSVVDFRKQAQKILEDIHKRGKIPILCGGTGLYIDALIYERDYLGDAPDMSRRQELEEFRKKNGNEALWEKLNAIDPKYAETLHINNYTYIIRGIEVFEKTGKSKLTAQHTPALKYPTFFLTPYDGNREHLYNTINTRVENMFNIGLLDEVGYIMDTFTGNCPGINTIGYKEVRDFLNKTISKDTCVKQVQQHNRNYAKRQITWNKKYGSHRNLGFKHAI